MSDITDPELAAAIVEELFHAWFRLVKGGCPGQWTEGQEEVMSSYIHALIRSFLELKKKIKDGNITSEEAGRRWNDPSGEWTENIPGPNGPEPQKRKTAVRSAMEDSDAGRNINGQPADSFRMDEQMRSWLKQEGLDFEVTPS